MKVEIPGQGELEIKTVVLDLNGTIVVRGQLVEGVKERVDTIKQKGLRVVLFPVTPGVTPRCWLGSWTLNL